MTKEKHQLKAEVRKVLGRKVKEIRKTGLIPSTIYGKDFESLSIQFELKELEKVLKEAGESSLVELIINDKENIPVLLRHPQYHPVSDILVHIDCYKVNLKEKITTMISLEFIGESASVRNGNLLVTVTDEIEVTALPTDLPDHIEVDLSVLEDLESVITVADLKIDKSKIEMLTHEEQLIAKTEEIKEEEEIIEEEELTPEDVEATSQKGDRETDEGEEEGKEENKDNKKEDKKEEVKEEKKKE